MLCTEAPCDLLGQLFVCKFDEFEKIDPRGNLDGLNAKFWLGG